MILHTNAYRTQKSIHIKYYIRIQARKGSEKFHWQNRPPWSQLLLFKKGNSSLCHITHMTKDMRKHWPKVVSILKKDIATDKKGKYDGLFLLSFAWPSIDTHNRFFTLYLPLHGAFLLFVINRNFHSSFTSFLALLFLLWMEKSWEWLEYRQ